MTKNCKFAANFRGISKLFFFHKYAVIRTCTYLYSSNYSPQMWRSRIRV